jgi:cytoskeletal protein CcmA (bactofilin family)
MFDKYRDNREEQSQAAKAAVSSERKDGPASATKPAAGSARTMATIGSTITIKGDVAGDENLIIDGKVDGTVNLASHELIVGPSGKVNADLSAKSIRIDGEVKGDITGKEKVLISKTGNVRGNIVAPRVTLEDGAKFKGSIDMDPSVASAGETAPVARAFEGKTGEQARTEPDTTLNEKKA